MMYPRAQTRHPGSIFPHWPTTRLGRCAQQRRAPRLPKVLEVKPHSGVPPKSSGANKRKDHRGSRAEAHRGAFHKTTPRLPKVLVVETHRSVPPKSPKANKRKDHRGSRAEAHRGAFHKGMG